MKVEQRSIKKHLFICTNKPSCGDNCGSKNSEELVKKLKARLKDEGLWDEIKVTKSGCLGGCAFGVNATIYPDNLFLSNLDTDNEDELYELLTR